MSNPWSKASVIKLHINSRKSILVKKNSSLIDALARANIFIAAACGGRGQCGLCRIKIANPRTPTQIEKKIIPREMLNKGYRLACQYQLNKNIKVSVPRYKRLKTTSSNQVGLALDLGTTIIKGANLDLNTGRIIDQAKVYNLQNNYGGDIITRISIALDNKYQTLRDLLLKSVDILKAQLGNKKPAKTVVVGNPVMSSFWLDRSLAGLARHPFNSDVNEGYTQNEPPLTVLPAIASFVGGDTLSGILAAGLNKATEPALYIDLGTNGEVVLATWKKIYVTSTAAGPAFEGVGITSGTLAVPGAVTNVFIRRGEIVFRTIENKKPIGFCASGLIDLVSVLLQSGYLKDNGRLRWSFEYKGLLITQDDIRKLQLSVGAIHAGIVLLLKKAKLPSRKIKKIILTGEFGSALNPGALMQIGLLPNIRAKIIGKADLALKGAVLVSYNEKLCISLKKIKEKCIHINIANEPSFEKTFVNALRLVPWN